MPDTSYLANHERYAASTVERDGTCYFLARDDAGRKRLGIVGDGSGFEGALHGEVQGEAQNEALLCPLTAANAAALRARLPWLNPTPLGLATSAGFGDRLGLATPGHAGAVQGTGVAPIFAQQSVRENVRTGRTPQQVLDDATWGLFQVGWREPWGADADHLKTPADLAPFVAAGYTFYVFDPGDHVDHTAHSDPQPVLREKFAALPWSALESTPEALQRDFLGQKPLVDSLLLEFDPPVLLRAAAKYGRAVAHAATMYRSLAALAQGRPFEVEISVDETDTPTSVYEHVYVARELQRLGVSWVSLAPRFVGRFEKGVDYQGDLDLFTAELARHAAVARHFGGYKLSLHSGSDKFSIYPIVARYTRGRVHLKTAGTSYLEALRVVAQVEPGFFRTLLDFARARYETDRASYYVSARVERVPVPAALDDAELPGLLEQFDARQVLHVTFGALLEQFGAQLKALLGQHEEAHYAGLEKHFARHLAPFSPQVAAPLCGTRTSTDERGQAVTPDRSAGVAHD